MGPVSKVIKKKKMKEERTTTSDISGRNRLGERGQDGARLGGRGQRPW